MKQPARLVHFISCLVLALPALAAVTPTAGRPLGYVANIKTRDEHTLPGLRGGLLASKTMRSPSRLHIHQPIIALQASQGTKLQAASGSKNAGRQTAKRSHSLLHRFFTTLLQDGTTEVRIASRKQAHKVGACRRNKLRWWVKIKKTCVKAFGKDSRWDKNKNDGKCASAFADCNTFMYAMCCSQPVGPKNMEAYCANQDMVVVNASDSKKEGKDKACQVQNKMRGIKDSLAQIKDTIGLLSIDKAVVYLAGPGPAPAPTAVQTAPAQAPPPSGLIAPGRPAPAPAPAPMPTSNALADRCAMLTALTRQAAAKIDDIKLWATQDGIKANRDEANFADQLQESTDAKSPEAKDPDLVFSVKGVIHTGEKLNAMLKNPSFCSTGDDNDEDDSEEDTADDEDDDDAEAIAINETAIMDLLNWDTDMKDAVDQFETNVHPHGFKWWRYRYEYTMIESIVLAFSVIVMYLVMWLLHGVSFFQVNKFYKTGQPARFYRYAWAYLVFHAASLMVMVTSAYMLYIPWGQQNIFNVFAAVFKDFVDGRANVPFLGYSWMYMVLDVQFQLFICFVLYSLFIIFVASNYQRALEDWKHLSYNPEDPNAKASNARLFKTFEAIMKKRVKNTPEYRQIFHELKLSLPGVSGLDSNAAGWSEFKLHLYLTDALGKSMEYLVQVSLTTTIFLAGSSLVVAALANHYQVAFMYFLPGFLVLGLALFIAGYFVSNHFRALSDNDDHNTPTKYVTVHSYCRAIQIMLYCVFFSFSRLLLSNDIFTFYPRVYISALIGLAVVMALLAIIAGEMIKETACALILPPHLPQDQFQNKLQQIVHWHQTESCHECGVQQFPAHSSHSREWAGKRSQGERKEGPPESARPYSFRG